MKDLHYYKRALNLTNNDLREGFEVSVNTLASWLNRGAPQHVLKSLALMSEGR